MINKILVQQNTIFVKSHNGLGYILLTDIARHKDNERCVDMYCQKIRIIKLLTIFKKLRNG